MNAPEFMLLTLVLGGLSLVAWRSAQPLGRFPDEQGYDHLLRVVIVPMNVWLITGATLARSLGLGLDHIGPSTFLLGCVYCVALTWGSYRRWRIHADAAGRR